MVTGRVGLVTGAARGIGKAITESLLSKGNKIAMCDMDEKMGRSSCDELAGKFGEQNVKFFHCDVSNGQQFEGCFKSAIKDLGPLNLVVNNAGVADESNEGWIRTIATNLTGTVHGSKLALKYMGHRQGGSGGLVVNFSSIVALKDSSRVTPVYGASKAAVKHFTYTMAQDIFYKAEGVKFMTIAPGPTETDFLDKMIHADLAADTLKTFYVNYPPQSVRNITEGIMSLIDNPLNGTVWLISDNKPPVRISTQEKI